MEAACTSSLVEPFAATGHGPRPRPRVAALGAAAKATAAARAVAEAAAAANGGPRRSLQWHWCRRLGHGLWLPAVALVALVGAASGAYTDAKPLTFKGDFDPFKTLGIARSTELPSKEDLKKAFKKAALKWHPDRCGRRPDAPSTEECEARMEAVHLAQEVLQDDRKLQMWEAWDEDRRAGRGGGGGRRAGAGSAGGHGSSRSQRSQGNGAGGHRPHSAFGAGRGADDPFRHFDFGGFGGGPFGGGGKPGGSSGGRKSSGQRKQGASRRPAPSPPPPPPPARKPSKPAMADSQWRVISKRVEKGIGGAKVETITRERDVPNTPMVQEEVLERTCYEAQVQCQEQVLERRRRRKDAEL